MKDLGKTKFCLGLQIEHLTNGIFVHQLTYTEKVLKRFYMDKSHPLSTPMVVRSLDINKDPFRPKENDEELIGDETPYLSAIGALIYLQGTIDLGLFFSYESKSDMIGYADAGYLSDPHKARSQTGYLFTYGGTAISWCSMKQTIAATSSNHAEIIAIHEASRECVWLRSMT
ncbi:secreted RxLR effector protein 161-like [Lycium barbarum]|uniref:secreted RxLR effector protein 161-like n=1 Tax=Lycium barbarum TaxID=112863 RepID=UPI00293F72D6|nr:secreted RxLR effector protein 161-like [Lycium barbarum]